MRERREGRRSGPARCVGRRIGLWLVPLVVAGCVESRSRPTVPVFGRLAVFSDPAGAEIAIDGRAIGSVTPDTVDAITAGSHRLDLTLDGGAQEVFTWRDSVDVPEEGLATVDAALQGGCFRDCPFLVDRNDVRCRLNTVGDTCAGAFHANQPGLQWPGSTGDYAAGGRLLVAAILDPDAGVFAGDTVATLVYEPSWTGRRPVAEEAVGGRQRVDRRYWARSSVPGLSLLGLSVTESLLAVDSAAAAHVLFIHYEIANVSGDDRYRRLHPEIPDGGYTFRDLYVGFGLDADVGAAADDLGTFDLDLGLAFMYDADFQDVELGDAADAPALVGLVTVEPPAAATVRTLTLWRIDDDWDLGLTGFAWRLLAGRLATSDPIDDHASPDVGYVSGTPNDYRLTQAHGPLELAPGASFDFTVALLMAEPVSGTFLPGVVVSPGDPTSVDRSILEVAGSLRALAAEVPELWDRHRP